MRKNIEKKYLKKTKKTKKQLIININYKKKNGKKKDAL